MIKVCQGFREGDRVARAICPTSGAALVACAHSQESELGSWGHILGATFGFCPGTARPDGRLFPS